MNPHVQLEMAFVWSGGGRRYFTQKAALRGAAKRIIRDALRGTGEVCNDPVQFQAWVKQLVGKIERGERPELDFDADGALGRQDETADFKPRA
jgi:hypothetical protein